MIKQFIFVLFFQLIVFQTVFSQEFFLPGYGESDYKSPGLYARKDYFKTIETLNRDQMSYKTLSECITRMPQNGNEALIKSLQEENYYLKVQNAKLLNELVYNKKLK